MTVNDGHHVSKERPSIMPGEETVSDSLELLSEKEHHELIQNISKLDLEEIEEILLRKRGIDRSAGASLRRQEAWSGPFPKPQDAKEYEKILPGFLERSLREREENSRVNREVALQNATTNRIAVERGFDNERKESENKIHATIFGMKIASRLFIITITCALLSAGAGIYCHDDKAFYISGAFISLPVCVFLGKFMTTLWKDRSSNEKPQKESDDHSTAP